MWRSAPGDCIHWSKIAGSGLDEMGELWKSEATLQPCETAWDLGSALKMVTFKAYRLPE